MTSREELRKALLLIRNRLGGLDWVSRDAGIPVVKALQFSDGHDLSLSDEEVKFLLDWYYFAGPT